MSLNFKDITQDDVNKHFLQKEAFVKSPMDDVNNEEFLKKLSAKSEMSDGKVFKKSFSIQPYKPTLGKPIDLPKGGRKTRRRRRKILRKTHFKRR